jgi:hypothetical protein
MSSSRFDFVIFGHLDCKAVERLSLVWRLELQFTHFIGFRLDLRRDQEMQEAAQASGY